MEVLTKNYQESHCTAWKFSDGRLIQFGYTTVTVDNEYILSEQAWLAVPFVGLYTTMASRGTYGNTSDALDLIPISNREEADWFTVGIQRKAGGMTTPREVQWLAIGPVSYTHLDVYKRQPYDYTFRRQQDVLLNPHYGDCDFKMIIYGPCTDPRIVIAGQIYEVKTKIKDGEYLVIQSREGLVYRVTQDGGQVNEFANKNNEYPLFAKIPPGSSLSLIHI